MNYNPSAFDQQQPSRPQNGLPYQPAIPPTNTTASEDLRANKRVRVSRACTKKIYLSLYFLRIYIFSAILIVVFQ
jgi:hypothetical protein